MRRFISRCVPPALMAVACCVVQAGPPSSTAARPKMIDQGQHDPRLKGYLAPEGIKVEIVAMEPVVVNPIGMAFAPDGALYVVEWVPGKISKSQVVLTYRDGTRRRLTVLKKTVKDQVKLLCDSRGKGIYDQAKVVLQDELPASILIHDGWMYLAGQESLRPLQDGRPRQA